MLHHPSCLLVTAAQAAQTPTQRILFWCAVMAGLLLVAFIVIIMARRRHRAAANAEDAPSFSISSLRQMHEEGKLDDEEYERARAVIIARAKGALEGSPPVMPVRKPPPPQADNGGGDDDLGPELLGPDDKGPPPPPSPPGRGDKESGEDAGSDR